MNEDNKTTPQEVENTSTSEENTNTDQSQELEKMTELAKRTMADLQNLKRRHEEERKAIYFSANAGLISNLLPSLDNLKRGLSHVPEELKSNPQANEWLKGFEMTIEQLTQIFKNSGLEEIDPINQNFNPDLHEAITQGPGEENTVVEVFEKGYKLGESVLRHAKVKVGNGEK